MRFKLDDKMPIVVADILKDHGHEAETVYSEAISGIRDPALLEVCEREQRILLTLDLDFANLVDYPPGSYPGIAIFRLGFAGPNAVIVAVRRWLLATAASPPEPDALWIVSDNRIWVRMAPHRE